MNKIQPDFQRLEDICKRHDSIGCFVYGVKKLNHKFRAEGRMFAPAIGVAEDIVNGNSSGCVGAYLLETALKNGNELRELNLNVVQGMAFNMRGLVDVLAIAEKDGIRTYLQGTAWYAGVELAEIRV